MNSTPSGCLKLLLATALVVPAYFGAGAGNSTSQADAQPGPDVRVLHALNRLTFGPKPGELAAVKKAGIGAWIEQQLHPESIDDARLNALLSEYPALSMSVPDLLRELPPPPVIRQVIHGKFPMPGEGELQPVYQTQVALIEQRLRHKTLPGGSGQGSSGAAAGSSFAEGGQTPPSVEDKQAKIFADLHATATVNLPPAQRLASITAMQPDERIKFFRALTSEERIALFEGLTPQQAQFIAAMRNPVQTVATQLTAAKMLRVAQSNRQLQQVMADFWLNHFNVDIRKSPLMPYYLIEYERDVIQPNALGNFEDLLVATARSRAMLLYLDNAESVGPRSAAALHFRQNHSGKPAPGINENYGRELMELHTLGVNGGYTQKDVDEVAKAFTGWTIDAPLRGGGFVFNPQRHEPGSRVVLGHRIPAGGESQGLAVLHLLAGSPATAQHISQELAERFVSDHPPQALVARMSATFRKTHGNIGQVLRTMLAAPEFWSTGAANAKVKTPLEFVASAMRASETTVQSPEVAALAVESLGMPLYGCQPPTGYSMQSSAWVSAGALVERMNFAMAFAGNRLPGLENDWDALIGAGAVGMTSTEKQARLQQLLLHGGVSAATHGVVLKQLANWPASSYSTQPFVLRGGPALGYVAPTSLHAGKRASKDVQAAMTAGLLIGSPDFQSR